MKVEKSSERNTDDLKGKRTSISYLETLSYEKAIALLPSERLFPRYLYGLDDRRTTLPPVLRQQIWEIAGRGEVLHHEMSELTLMLMLLTDEFYLAGINHKGRFVYDVNDSSRPLRILPESVARAHHVRILEILRKRLLCHRGLDEISILLMGLTGTLEFTGLDRNGDLEIRITRDLQF
jgi:hypothetical protein